MKKLHKYPLLFMQLLLLMMGYLAFSAMSQAQEQNSMTKKAFELRLKIYGVRSCFATFVYVV